MLIRTERVKRYFWRLLAPLIRTLCLDRILWRQRVEPLNLDGGWKTAHLSVRPHLAFLLAVPYRPGYSTSLESEKKLLTAALAVANHQYFANNLRGYMRTVSRVGSYLEHEKRTNVHAVRNSDVWADYLHGKATLDHIRGESSKAASRNSEASELFSSRDGRELEALMYEGCTMCCRVESVSENEQHVVVALDKHLRGVMRRFDDLITEPRVVENMTDVRITEFYLHMLRCKIETHKREPDPTAIANAIESAKGCRAGLDGEDARTYDVAVPFYEAILSKLNRESTSQTAKHYDRAIVAQRASQVPYFCLLRVPESVAISLANHVRRPRLSPDETLLKLKVTRSRSFLIQVVAVLAGALALPLLFNLVVPLASLAQGVVTIAWPAAFGLSMGTGAVVVSVKKLLTERNEAGLVSPNLLEKTFIASSVYVSFSITLFTAAAIESVDFLSRIWSGR